MNYVQWNTRQLLHNIGKERFFQDSLTPPKEHNDRRKNVRSRHYFNRKLNGAGD